MQKTPNTFQYVSAPKAYVAGLGRGANAFQTSAATGSISTPSFGIPPVGYVAGSGRGSGGFGEKKPEPQTIANSSANSSGGRFDAFLGYEGAALTGVSEYGDEDRYADAVYDGVDNLRKRKDKRKPANVQSVATGKAIADNYADITTKLKQMPAEEWYSIPEAQIKVKTSHKRPAPGFDRFTPVTDSILASAAASATSRREDLSGFSQARDQRLRVTLDREGDSVLGQTVVDPHGMLTALNGDIGAAANLGDVKKARMLLKSVTNTNPTHGPGWIAKARVEELAGRLSKAREIMRQARSICADQEDVWLESARIEDANEAKAILALGVARYLPESVSLWMAAADLELTAEEAIQEGLARSDVVGSWKRRTESSSKPNLGSKADSLIERSTRRKTLLIRALERIPDSAKLWTLAYAMETDDAKAITLLERAIVCCPSTVEFAISLAWLHAKNSPESAQRILNDARKRFPGEIRIWIAAAKLVEDTRGPESFKQLVDMMRKAVEKIAAHVDRSTWLKNAVECEQDDYLYTCEAIIQASLGLGVDEDDRQRTLLGDARSFEKSGHIQCARLCLDQLLEIYNEDEDIWFERISFAKRHPDKDKNPIALLKAASARLPDSQVIWLMYAKEVWLSGDLAGARNILEDAFKTLGANSEAGEEIWFAAAKLAQEVSLEEARGVLIRARAACAQSERVWIKSIVLERKFSPQQSHEEELAREAIKRFPKSEKLWLMLGQVLEFLHPKNLTLAKQVYLDGVESCESKSPFRLWLALARVEEQLSTGYVTARAILASSRSKIPNSVELWLASIRLEKRAKEPDSVVNSLLARALQALPLNGSLLAEQIELAPEAKQKGVAEDAVQKTNAKDAKVVLATARVWWRQRPLDAKKCQRWLERAVTLDPKLGDAWGSLLRFTEEQKEETASIISRCIVAAPTHGERWIRVSKKRGHEDLKPEKILKLVAISCGPDEYVDWA